MDVTITGKISDEQGNGIVGVNVLEKGTTRGTVSDGSGNFSLRVTGVNSVLVFSAVGYTSQEIADKLFISESTVNGHRNNLLAKTGARNTAGLVLFAIRNNLFDIDFNE